VEAQARRLVRKNWEEHLDAIHQPERIGFVFQGNAVIPLADAADIKPPAEGNTIQAPIAITGEALGTLAVEMDAQELTPQNIELANIIARQVAQQIENLRLLESAERYRYDAEQAARLQTIEGWQKYIASRPTDSLRYFYDRKEVRSHSEGQDDDVSMFALPLKARDEMIGKLSVQGLTYEDQESVELVNAVADRLSAHIENLRLFEETRLGQIELDRRAQQLAAVAEISTMSSREQDVEKMLETVVHLTQRKFGLNHAHVFLFNETSRILKISACGWKEGDPHEALMARRRFRLTRNNRWLPRRPHWKAVIVNNVKSEPGWLANPMLPDTQAEMASRSSSVINCSVCWMYNPTGPTHSARKMPASKPHWLHR
jgi:GAF domain-containing protein